MYFLRESGFTVTLLSLLWCGYLTLFLVPLSCSSKDSDIILNNYTKDIKILQNVKHLSRKSRAVHEIFLSDPFDCLSQLGCKLVCFHKLLLFLTIKIYY